MMNADVQAGRFPKLIQAAVDAFGLPDLRAKILFTLAILALLAVGCDAGADPDHDRPPTVPILEVPILAGRRRFRRWTPAFVIPELRQESIGRA